MSAPAFAQPMPVPPASTPMPAIIALVGAAGACRTVCQCTVVTRKPPTTRLRAPKTYVARCWIHTRVAWPRPDTSRVRATKASRHTTVSAEPVPTPKAMCRIASRAYAAVVVLTTSQPPRDSQDTSVGPWLPRGPKTARDRVMLGAPPHLPATLMSPTTANDPKEPMAPTSTACQMFRPRSATRVAPRGRARTEMLAANQTQKSWSGLPSRSPSGTGSMPRAATAPTLLSGVMGASFGQEIGSGALTQGEQAARQFVERQPVDGADGGDGVAGEGAAAVAGAGDRSRDGRDRVAVAPEGRGEQARPPRVVGVHREHGDRGRHGLLGGEARAHEAVDVGGGRLRGPVRHQLARPPDAGGDVGGGDPVTAADPGGGRLLRAPGGLLHAGPVEPGAGRGGDRRGAGEGDARVVRHPAGLHAAVAQRAGITAAGDADRGDPHGGAVGVPVAARLLDGPS